MRIPKRAMSDWVILKWLRSAGLLGGPDNGDVRTCLRCGAACYRRPDPEYEQLTGFKMYHCPTCRTEQNHEGLE